VTLVQVFPPESSTVIPELMVSGVAAEEKPEPGCATLAPAPFSFVLFGTITLPVIPPDEILTVPPAPFVTQLPPVNESAEMQL
jgi:hypothetical protein